MLWTVLTAVAATGLVDTVITADCAVTCPPSAAIAALGAAVAAGAATTWWAARDRPSDDDDAAWYDELEAWRGSERHSRR